MILRDERPGDEEAIGDLTARAFSDMPFSDGSEPAIIDRLRQAGGLSLSIVAEDRGTIVGHVAFSPVAVSDGSVDWYGLGPISVDPERQRSGIGSRLVVDGLDRLRAIGAAGCVLLGDPGFYGRFGFSAVPDLILPDVPADHFLAVAFSPVYAAGTVSYHPAFYG